MNEEKIRSDVPITSRMLTPEYRPVYLRILRGMDAKRLWIVPDRNALFTQDRGEHLSQLQEQLTYFRDNGMETGLWITVLGFGNNIANRNIPWTRLRSVTGIHLAEGDVFCPEDPDFLDAFLSYVQQLAGLDADLLMLDDEFCLSHPGIGCFCDRHLKKMSDLLGEELTMEGLPERIFTGGKNRYRDVWFQVAGDTMRNTCLKIRQTVDRVKPSLRVGLCAGKTHWDIEGTDTIELAKILAGANKPFLRLMAAPYWVACDIHNWPGQRLNGVIETARMQIAWCENEKIEFFAEADSHPRPCYHVNASLIELFDIAMRAQGVSSLKYVLDYYAPPEYEKKYLQLQKRNEPLYRRIEAAFADKKSTGVRVFCPMHTIQNAVLPDFFLGEAEIIRLVFPQAASILTGIGVPVCYNGAAQCGAAFGEDAHAIDTDCAKLILDLPAARILQEKGVDVGLRAFDKAPVPRGLAEVFPEGGTKIFGFGMGGAFAKTGGLYRTELKEGAQILSRFRTDSGAYEEEYIASYSYDNGKTQFLVFTFDARAAGENSGVACSYYRQKQVMDFVGGYYPYIRGAAEMYSICAASADGNKQAVLFENLSRDPVFDFVIELGRACTDFVLFGAEGTLSEDRTQIQIKREFAPSAAMVLEVTY